MQRFPTPMQHNKLEHFWKRLETLSEGDQGHEKDNHDDVHIKQFQQVAR